MAGPEFEVPTLTEYTEVPKVKEGAMGHLKSFIAAEASQTYLGYPHELPADWKERDRKSTRLNSSHEFVSRMPSSA